ncbi:MAG: pilus assembly protein N-terminal domain-containing protein [Gemmatimonadota bacterium]
MKPTGLPSRRLLLGALLLVLPGSRFECGTGDVLGTGPLEVKEVFVSPGSLSLRVGEVATLEGFGRDGFGGTVEVQLVWEAADPQVAGVAPKRGRVTVVTGRSPGETEVRALHRTSGAADTVPVSVSASS